MQIDRIIVSPVLTEKTTNLVKNKTYVFIVNRRATKKQVKDALEKIYEIEVEDVRTAIRKGKEIKVGRRMLAKKLPDRKVAFVKVGKGKIDVFPQP
jgi:large subunit ribosomal protein L23